MIKSFYHGLLSSNVYVVYDSGEAMIIDAGASVEPIRDFVVAKVLNALIAILVGSVVYLLGF